MRCTRAACRSWSRRSFRSAPRVRCRWWRRCTRDCCGAAIHCCSSRRSAPNCTRGIRRAGTTGRVSSFTKRSRRRSASNWTASSISRAGARSTQRSSGSIAPYAGSMRASAPDSFAELDHGDRARRGASSARRSLRDRMRRAPRRARASGSRRRPSHWRRRHRWTSSSGKWMPATCSGRHGATTIARFAACSSATGAPLQRIATLHWVLVQAESLSAVLGKPRDPGRWEAAKLSRRDALRASGRSAARVGARQPGGTVAHPAGRRRRQRR